MAGNHRPAGHSLGQEGFPPNSFDRPSLPALRRNHHELGIGFPADKNQPAGCCMLGSSDNSRWLSDVWGRIMEHATFARGTRHYNP